MAATTANAICSKSRRADFRYVPRTLLLFLRVHLGVIMTLTVIGKLMRPQFSTFMVTYLQRTGPHQLAWYRAFVQNVVLPNAALFATLIVVSESLVAISLTTGTATRLGSAIAMFLFLNYMLSKGHLFWYPDSEDAAIFFSALVCLIGAAGRVWGVDAHLARRWPHVLLW